MRMAAFLLGVSTLWSASCGGGADPVTLGEYCDSTGSAFCHRAETCQIATFNACFQDFKRACCLDAGNCGLVAMDAAKLQSIETKCTAALSTEPCPDVAAGVAPAACLMSP
jgi:hypothetical protein